MSLWVLEQNDAPVLLKHIFFCNIKIIQPEEKYMIKHVIYLYIHNSVLFFKKKGIHFFYFLSYISICI